MRVGRHMEAEILAHYAEESGNQVDPNTPPPWIMFAHPKFPFLLATPDAFALTPDGQTILVEAKTAGHRSMHRWGEAGTDGVPDEYRLQVALYMAVLDLEVCHVAANLGGNDFRIYVIPRQKELESALVLAATKFWTGAVEAKKIPEIDGSDAAAKAVAHCFPRSVRPARPATESEEAALNALGKLKYELEAMENEKKNLENIIKACMTDAEGLDGQIYTATWKSTKDTTKIDWEGAAKEAAVSAEIITKHSTTVPGVRRFLFKEKGKK
jgi:predicted phage-related endonuclease